MQFQTRRTLPTGMNIDVSKSSALALSVLILITSPASADENGLAGRKVEPVDREAALPTESQPSWDVVLSDGSYGGRMGRIPSNVKVQHYTIDEHGQQQKVGGPALRSGLKEIYRNVNLLYPSPDDSMVGAVWHRDDGPVADDMTTVAIEPCELAEIQVDVHGGNLDPEADYERYSVTLQVWKCCPGQCEIILPPGTSAALTDPITFSNLKDNELSVLTIPIPAGTIPPTTTIWVSGIFPNNDIPGDPLHVGAGFIVGSPPEIGYSNDGLDVPQFHCNAKFSIGWPEFQHGSIAARVFAYEDCESQFPDYSAVEYSNSEFDRGSNIQIADDVTLAVDGCELGSYEIGVIGISRTFQLRADLRTGPFDGPFPHPLDTIPGTEGVYLGRGLGEREIARFTFPPGIAVPKEIWVTWSVNRRNTGAILTEEALIGSSSDLYAYEDAVGTCTVSRDPCLSDEDCNDAESCTFWSTEDFPGDRLGIFHVAINCRGDTPTGACCRPLTDNPPPDGLCGNDITLQGCPFGSWLQNEACDPDPFFPPCGSSICGDGITTGLEGCDDGTLNGSGEGYCLSDCSAVQTCGDGIANGSEICDGTDDARCSKFACQSDCTCRLGKPRIPSPADIPANNAGLPITKNPRADR